MCDYRGAEIRNGQSFLKFKYEMGELEFCDEDCAAEWFKGELDECVK
jgi:hypothetical protein